jgi:hypothetical protein
MPHVGRRTIRDASISAADDWGRSQFLAPVARAVGDNAAMEAEPPKANPPKRKRRWFQFSLRTVLIVVTLLAVPLAYVGWQAKIVRERRWLLESVLLHQQSYIPICPRRILTVRFLIGRLPGFGG